jgi:glutamate/tyrosine decarboxylase-like PLP-dependent enzyme
VERGWGKRGACVMAEGISGALGANRDEVRAAWRLFADLAADFSSVIRQARVSADGSADEWILSIDSALRSDGRIPLDRLTAALLEKSLHTGVQVTHPRHFGLFIAPVWPEAVLGEAIASLFNFQLSTPKLAPLACAIEAWTLKQLGDLAGGGWSDAHFTNGGSEANLTALLAALSCRFPERAEGGWDVAAAKPRLYLTSETHESMIKAAKIAGIGESAVVLLENACPEELRERIAGDIASGASPFMIVGTLGTPATGSIEPLADFADVASETGCWFHVDAAWGAGAALSPKRSALLAGAERADSLVWDAHKWMCASLVCGMIFCRRPGALARSLDISASYMPRHDGEPELFRSSVPWSRRSLGLKVFVTIAAVGWEGLASHVERTFDIAARLRGKLRQSGWVIVNDTPLPVLCFNRAGLETPEQLGAVVSAIQEEGIVWLTSIPLPDGRAALRVCIKNSSTTEEDLEILLERLERFVA